MTLRALLRRVITPPLVVLAVLVVLFEETFWRWMTALGHWLAARLPVFTLLERLIERMSPPFVGIVFAVPLALLIPVKLAAVWLIVHRHVFTGVALVITVKVLATAFSARLFALAKPKLMQVKSFAWAYGHVTRWIAFAHDYVDAIPAWRRAKALITSARHRFAAAGKGFLSRLWNAARRRAMRIRMPG
ncbi:MAG TPA: hypothetical protein VKS60_02530 [Stellaceae bacterium]|nr:hypothetical protein [Stellaceae bacterium]